MSTNGIKVLKPSINPKTASKGLSQIEKMDTIGDDSVTARGCEKFGLIANAKGGNSVLVGAYGDLAMDPTPP